MQGLLQARKRPWRVTAEAVPMTMLVKTGVLATAWSSCTTVMMKTTKAHPHSSVVVMVVVLLVLPGVLRLLPLSATGQQHTLVGVARVVIQNPMDDDEAWLLSNYRCIILLANS